MKMRNIKVAAAAAMAALLIFSAAACGTDPTGASGSSEPSVVSSAEGEAEKADYNLIMSYANSEYLDSGDESLTKLIRSQAQPYMLDVDPAEDPEEAKAEKFDLAWKVIDGLNDNQPAEGGKNLVPADAVKGLTVDWSAGECVVDLDGSLVGDLSMYNETFTIYQLADSLMMSFPEINSVAFTVDGAAVAALNYMDISAPFTRDDVSEFSGLK